MNGRWQVYVAAGTYRGRWPDWNTTWTKRGANRICARLNRSLFAIGNGIVFGVRRTPPPAYRWWKP